MSIQIYKPNKSNSGFAFSFYTGENFKDKSPILFINAIAQHSWDDSRKVGSFSGNKKNQEKNISIKFNQFECGSIVSSIINRFEWNTYHSFEDNRTQIKLSPWDKEISTTRINQKTKESYQEKYKVPAFGLSITRNGSQTFKIPLEPGEAQCLRILCEEIVKKSCEHNVYKSTKKVEPEEYEF
jgi:hypothetical protein